MKSDKYSIGELIEQVTETNSDNMFGSSDVMGMTITKEIIPTKANVNNTDLKNFLVIKPGEFIFNPRTHGKHIGFGYNNSNHSFIISWNNIGFRVKEEMRKKVLSEYLFLHFNRDEWDREACYRSWGSSTEVFTWDALCEMKLVLPPLNVQQKFVDIYKAMVANQQSYERGLEDLKKVFDSYIDKLRKQGTITPIGNYLDEIKEKNEKLLYGEDSVRGISIEKKFIYTKANMDGVNLKPYYVVKPNEFAYVSVTSRNGEKISLAINDSNETYICSSSYIAFKSKDTNILWPKYLMLFLLQSEFDRYARFNSWGSARETFDWEEMCNVQIPIPDIQTQKAIADIFTVYTTRKKINEQLKEKIKAICPILIRGSLANGG